MMMSQLAGAGQTKRREMMKREMPSRPAAARMEPTATKLGKKRASRSLMEKRPRRDHPRRQASGRQPVKRLKEQPRPMS